MRQERKLVRIADLRPNNWWLKRPKVDAIARVWHSGDPSKLPPVLVAPIGGDLALIDGHSRTFQAQLRGASQILCDIRPIRGIDDFGLLYELLYSQGMSQEIRAIEDLTSRVIPEDVYDRVWIEFCKQLSKDIGAGRRHVD